MSQLDTLQQIGALLASDYDLRQRQLASITFTQADANNAARTVPVGFQPRLVLVVGTCIATLASRVYGGGVTAFAIRQQFNFDNGHRL